MPAAQRMHICGQECRWCEGEHGLTSVGTRGPACDAAGALLLINNVPEPIRGKDQEGIARCEGDGRELRRRRDAVGLQVRIAKGARDCEVTLHSPASSPDDLPARSLPYAQQESSRTSVTVRQTIATLNSVGAAPRAPARARARQGGSACGRTRAQAPCRHSEPAMREQKSVRRLSKLRRRL